MPATVAAVDPSTRKLSEVARHVVVPQGIVDTLWFEVERQCAEWGDSFDHWQDGLGQLALGLREDGTFAASIGGVTLSIPRQVAKTFIVGRIVFALCILFPNLTILWTAHRTRTATQTFNKLKGLAKKSGVKVHMAPGGGIRSVNGEQEFEFANGSKIMFGAREQGFGRGFDEVDIEVFDEAQILTEKALEDMVAATNQSRFVHGALLFFMGTPPRPSDPGQEFANRRTEALALKEPDVVYAEGEDSMYVECSADPKTGKPGGPELDDPEQVKIANPSVPERTPWMAIKRLRKQLTNDDSWRREGLGLWDDFEASALILPRWYDRATTADPGQLAAIGIAVSLDRAWASIGAVDEAGHLAAAARNRGTDWIVEEAKRLKGKYGSIPIVMAGRGPGASLIDPMKLAGVEPLVASSEDYHVACADLFDRVEAGTVCHGDYEDLNEAVIAARWTAGDNRTFARKSGDVSMLEAVTLALWGVGQDGDDSIYETRGLVTL